MATAESLPISEECLIDITWLSGSGYGVGVAEIPTRPGVYAIVLVNEDPGEVLTIARLWRGNFDILPHYITRLLRLIEAGRGPLLQTIFDATPLED